jgi:hypothetical protein
MRKTSGFQQIEVSGQSQFLLFKRHLSAVFFSKLIYINLKVKSRKISLLANISINTLYKIIRP